jgi:hypothetical protein
MPGAERVDERHRPTGAPKLMGGPGAEDTGTDDDDVARIWHNLGLDYP